MLPELKIRQKGKFDGGVEFYRSFKGIKTIISIMLKDVKKGDIYRTFSIDDSEKYEESRKKVFRAVKELIKEKKLIPRGIFHESTRNKPKKDSIMQKRYLNFPLPPNTIIMKNMVAILSWGSEPSGILIKSKDISKSYINFFEAMWKIGKR